MHDIPDMTLVLGGARSGKSAYAEDLAERLSPRRRYLATARAGEADLDARIAAHQARRNKGWTTVEAGGRAVAAPDLESEGVLLLDCLTLWLADLMERGGDAEAETAGLLTGLAARDAPTIVVSNELGQGMVPTSREAREFRDAHGAMNQRFAQAAGRVVLVTAGLPAALKGPLP